MITIKKKCDWGKRKNKILKSLTGFHSANKIDNYNRVGKKEKKRKNLKESIEQVNK